MRISRFLLRATTAVAAVAVLATGLTVISGAVAPEPAAALSGNEFRAGNIISDEAFFNSGSMTASDVQSFLDSKVSNCWGSNGQPCLKDYRQSTTTRDASAYCARYDGRANESAAEIIQRVGVACGINPQVLLVMLQKEQGLVESTSPTERMYRVAMGYGCPDTAECDTAYYGFFNQVYSGASQFQRYTKNSSSWSYQPGRNNNILYNPNASCGASPVFIENQATANLYIYTPYQPNAAALANLGGSGDSCSAYGNRNFWVYFNTWFPNSGKNWLQSPGFESGLVGWGESNGFVNRFVYTDPSQARSGSRFLATNTPAYGRALTQDVVRTTRVDEQATVTIWVKSASGKPFSGQLSVWGLGGGTQERVDTPFVAGGAYQQVTAKLPIRNADRELIRLDLYMFTTNETLLVDDSSMTFGSAPAPANLLRTSSFEGQIAPWKPGNGFVNYAPVTITGAPDGSWTGATNTSVAGRSMAQDVSISARSGEDYTVGLWASSPTGAPFSGRLVLWGFGGSGTQVAVTPFTVGSGWARVTTTLKLSSDITGLRAEIYEDTPNVTLYFDDAALGDEMVANGSFENGFDNWARRLPEMNQAVYRASGSLTAVQGSYFAATNTPVNNGSVYTDVSWQPVAGDTLHGDIWLRSDGGTVNGALALWALGGSNESAATAFSVGPEWTRIPVKLQVRSGSHTSVRLEVYLNPGATLFLDDAHLY